MNSRLTYFSVLLVSLCFFAGPVLGFDSASAVATEPDSYTLAPSPLSVTEVLEEASRVELAYDEGLYENVRSARKVIFSDFPISLDRTATVRLERFYVLAPYSVLIVGTDTLDMNSAGVDVTLLRGEIVDEPNSFVCLALSPIMCKGMVSVGEEQYAIGPDLEHGAPGDLALVDAHEYRPDFTCEVLQPDYILPIDHGREESDYQSLAGEFKIADVAIETDTFIVRYFDGYIPSAEVATACYIVSLVGLSSAIYERDLDVKHIICWLRVWPLGGPDPISLYPYTDTLYLAEYSTYWRDNMSHIDRTLGCLIQADPNCGGQGYLGTLCNKDWGMFSFSMGGCGGTGFYDILLYCHEAGHVHGSDHTFCYVPAIDSCDTGGGPGDPCYHEVTEQVIGTIMSYCWSVTLDFHPVVIDTIRNHVDNAACMRIARDPVYVDWSNTGYEDGTAANPYNTVLEGAETVMPGGTVLIAPGNYPETPLIPYPCLLLRNGTSGSVIIGY